MVLGVVFLGAFVVAIIASSLSAHRAQSQAPHETAEHYLSDAPDAPSSTRVARMIAAMPEPAKQPAYDNSAAILAELQRANDIAEQRASDERFWAIENTPLHPVPSAPAYNYELPPTPRRVIVQPPVSVYGSSIQIGDTTFHNYYSTDGQTVSGTTTQIGESTYTSLHGN